MRKIFLEKSHTKYGQGTGPRISKKSKLSIYYLTSVNIYTVCSYCISS